MAYSISDYNSDREYMQKHDSLPKEAPPESKLDILVNSGLGQVFVNHSGIIRSPRGCILAQVALGMLKHDVVMAGKIHERNGSLPPGEVKELSTELRDEISKRTTELFEEKYRGAKARVARYDARQAKEATKPETAQISETPRVPVQQMPEAPHFPVQRYFSFG